MAPIPKIKKVEKKHIKCTPNKHLRDIINVCDAYKNGIIHGAKVAMDYRGYELENTHRNLPTMEQVRPQLNRIPITRISLPDLNETELESLGYKNPASIRKDKRDLCWASTTNRAKGLSRFA